MILIPSSQFLKIEIQNEIGKLPPSFSFLQNRRLYHFQLDLLRKYWKNEKVVMTLPNEFTPNVSDADAILSREIKVYKSSSNISLGKHIADMIILEKPETIKILHGDTLFLELPIDNDVIVISSPQEQAKWDGKDPLDLSDLVWAGYFSFSDPMLFLTLLESNNFEFNKAVKSYSTKKKVNLVENNNWFDFGHLEGFHKSRQKFTTERSFNSLEINKYEVTKISSKKSKIKEEFTWFKNTPNHLQKFLPNVYDHIEASHEASYTMNYISGFSLSELMLYSNLEKFKWEKIINEIDQLLSLQSLYLPKNSISLAEKNIHDILNKKNPDRIDQIIQSKFINYEKLELDGKSLGSIKEIMSLLADYVLAYEPIPAHCHGDLCLSNMIYLSRGNLLKIIDPRGMKDDDDSIVGDKRYDLAKLAHSIVWGYDRVLSGEIAFVKKGNKFINKTKINSNSNQKTLTKLILSKENLKLIYREDIQALTAMLFLTMIPLHADSPSRQISLFGNGLKIFDQVSRKDSNKR